MKTRGDGSTGTRSRSAERRRLVRPVVERRQFLAGASTLLGALLAGCLGSEESPTETENRTTGTTATSATTINTRTASPRPTSDPATAVESSPDSERVATRSSGTESSDENTGRTTAGGMTGSTSGPSTTGGPNGSRFSVGERACLSGEERRQATGEGTRVLVTGTITGSDACATAVLQDVSFEHTGGERRLRVVVGTESAAEPGEVCGQCLTGIEYEARVPVGDRQPNRVVVVHRGAAGESRVAIDLG
jgi:hypothetical protein